MKSFAIYTVLRIGLFVTSYAVIGLIYFRIVPDGTFLVPLVGGAAVSALLSYRLLGRHREAFARSVQARAERASSKFEARRAREDVD